MNEDTAELVRGQTALAFQLHGRLARATENLVFSPLSISMALAAFATGARGATASELLRVLGISMTGQRLVDACAALVAELLAPGPTKARGFDLGAVLDLWVQHGQELLPSFQEQFTRMARGTVEHADFEYHPEEALQRINTKVAEETRGRIDQLLSKERLDRNTRRALISAAYFKAGWETQFDPEHTRSRPFHAPEGETTVPTMSLRDTFFHVADEDLQALELPYASRRHALLILLPRDVDGLYRAEERLGVDPDLLARLIQSLEPTDVRLVLPKFTFDSMLDLVPTVESLGVQSAFEAGLADFPGVGSGFFLESLIHAGWIAVDEEGTEAAAATAATLRLGAPFGTPIPFVADHPFLFVLRDRRTETVLFLGRVARPSVAP